MRHRGIAAGAVVSSSKGGADHPDNYLYAPSYTSGRPLAVVGVYDSLTAFAAGKAKTVKAFRVSRNRISRDHDVIDAKPRRRREDRVPLLG